MRIVFMGTPDIAATCLNSLLQSRHEIIAVYTKPDRPKNRGMKLEMSDVKKLALAHDLPVYQPTTFKDDAVYQELKALEPDCIAVVAYGKILPQRILDIPAKGCVNIHASVLPELRGSGPIQWSILNGMDETGVTAMYMAAGMDTGDMIEIRKTPIEPYENAQSLLERLADIGGKLLCDTMDAVEEGRTTRTPQDETKATYAPMLTKDLCPIDWSRSAREIIDHVRGLDPWPVATTMIQGKRFKIYAVRPVDRTTDKEPGTLLALTKTGLEIACGGGGVLVITVLQAEGGKRMAAPDYFRGHPITL